MAHKAKLRHETWHYEYVEFARENCYDAELVRRAESLTVPNAAAWA